jgi:FdhE protein
MKNGKWDARIRRANELASTHSFAAEGLRFYERVAQYQQALYAHIEKECGSVTEKHPAGSLRDELDLFILLPRFASFLSVIGENAPALLSHSADELRARDAKHWQEILTESWKSGFDREGHMTPAEALLSWTFLQPYAEYLADHSEQPRLEGTPMLCPVCNSKPQVGVLRPEGDGGKLSLVCSLCSTEWNFRRIVCAACGEEDEKKHAVYTAQEFSYVRVEGCDTCHRYIKTVDLTRNGHAVPVVDELATIPLNLWAAEHGYTKLQPNLLGI